MSPHDYSEYETSRRDLSWVIKPDLSDRKEPSTTQLQEANAWATERWIADLLRDENYIPTADVVKTMLVLASQQNNSSQEYTEDVHEAAAFTRLGIASQSTDTRQTDLLDTYEESYSKYMKSASYVEEYTLFREEEHPLFPHGLVDMDDMTARMSIARALCDRISETPAGAEVSEWMLDNLYYFHENSDPEEMTRFLYDMVSAAGRPNKDNTPFYHKLALVLASQKTIEGDGPFDATTEYTTPQGETITFSSLEDWNMTKVLFGFGEDSRHDSLDGLLFTISAMPEGHERNELLSLVYGQRGPAQVLNYMRQLINDEDMSAEDRRNASRLFRTFYEGVVQTADEQKIPPNIKNFYTLVADNEAFMTEEKEGESHHSIIKNALEENGIGPDDLVVEAACGKGWLTDRLRTDGFHVVGSDLNPDLLQRARARFPDSEFYLAPWDDLRAIPDAQDAKAFIINGRSIHHLQQFKGFHSMMSQMQQAKLIVFDAANPETGAQKDRLDIFRQSLESFEYDKEWLDTCMWQGVGSHDGVILGDRWYPPEQWWVNMMGMYGFETQTIHEENYDGRGTENMVIISRSVEDEQEKKELMERSRQFFMNLVMTQSVNPNGYAFTYI